MLFMFEMLAIPLSPELVIARLYAGMKSLKMSDIFLLRSRLNSGIDLVLSVLFVDGVRLVWVKVADVEEFGSET